MFYSPLRYPGGKNKLAAFIARLCVDNNVNGHYVEPYAGGAAVALFLLFEGFVQKVTINDKDRSIYAFWHSVLNETDQLCDMIDKAELTVDEWRKQREIQRIKEKVDLISLGFSTLFLNRTNHSGVIKGGVIGGYKQKGEYLIDCRFNKKKIIEKIEKIITKRDEIELHGKDALNLIKLINSKPELQNTIYYLDPPYFVKGSSLYMNHYKKNDHELVSELIKEMDHINWIISYDNVPQIQELYADYSKKEYSFFHTVNGTRKGKEILFFSPTIKQPEMKEWHPLGFKLKAYKTKKVILYKKQKNPQLKINL